MATKQAITATYVVHCPPDFPVTIETRSAPRAVGWTNRAIVDNKLDATQRRREARRYSFSTRAAGTALVVSVAAGWIERQLPAVLLSGEA